MASDVAIKVNVPAYDKMLWPTLQALGEIGGSGTIQEIMNEVIAIEKYTEAQQSVVHGEGPQTEIAYRLAWARTYLKKVGALENSSRGIWAITDRGRGLTKGDMAVIPSDVKAMSLKKKDATEKRATSPLTEVMPLDGEMTNGQQEQEGNESPEGWRSKLLDLLTKIPPDRFESLCQRILRESGFIRVEVTGKSGDGGIDGFGVLRIALISFQVLFQCKRYQGNVGAGDIRNFRGAMEGRADKGLFMTTGGFTPGAQKEASRDGAKVIDLIDGDDLCDHLKRLGLGVRTRQVEEITIDTQWFSEI